MCCSDRGLHDAPSGAEDGSSSRGLGVDAVEFGVGERFEIDFGRFYHGGELSARDHGVGVAQHLGSDDLVFFCGAGHDCDVVYFAAVDADFLGGRRSLSPRPTCPRAIYKTTNGV